MKRRVPLITGSVYHVMNKSIEHYTIFKSDYEYERFLKEMIYYRFLDNKLKFSDSILMPNQNLGKTRVDIIAYALMPTHFHLLLKQNIDNGISDFVNCLENSYSHYFNLKHQRKGPLWIGKFKNVLIEDDEQLLHVTKYIHLNPVKAKLVDDISKWKYSSYVEYVSGEENICSFKDIIDMNPKEYEEFSKDMSEYPPLGRVWEDE